MTREQFQKDTRNFSPPVSLTGCIWLSVSQYRSVNKLLQPTIFLFQYNYNKIKRVIEY